MKFSLFYYFSPLRLSHSASPRRLNNSGTLILLPLPTIYFLLWPTEKQNKTRRLRTAWELDSVCRERGGEREREGERDSERGRDR